jgi:hypothetical protein
MDTFLSLLLLHSIMREALPTPRQRTLKPYPAEIDAFKQADCITYTAKRVSNPLVIIQIRIHPQL